MAQPQHRPKASKPTDSAETVSANQPFLLLSGLSLAFCYSYGIPSYRAPKSVRSKSSCMFSSGAFQNVFAFYTFLGTDILRAMRARKPLRTREAGAWPWWLVSMALSTWVTMQHPQSTPSAARTQVHEVQNVLKLTGRAANVLTVHLRDLFFSSISSQNSLQTSSCKGRAGGCCHL